jgi:hypothetical protein
MSEDEDMLDSVKPLVMEQGFPISTLLANVEKHVWNLQHNEYDLDLLIFLSFRNSLEERNVESSANPANQA